MSFSRFVLVSLALLLLAKPAEALSLPAKQAIVGIWGAMVKEPHFSFKHRLVFLPDGSMTGDDETIIDGVKQTHHYTGVYWMEGKYLMIISKENGKVQAESVEFRLTLSRLELIEKEDSIVLERLK